MHGNSAEVQKFDRDLLRALDILSGNHIGYHLGDECILAGHGSVEGKTFKVGLCSYKYVMLPSMLTLDAKTFELLKEFAANGGKIWSLGDKPTMVDGAHSDELCEFMKDIESLRRAARHGSHLSRHKEAHSVRQERRDRLDTLPRQSP